MGDGTLFCPSTLAVKRKYPKQNRPGGNPQDEPKSHGEPKIASHRKDVAAYFLGGGAAIALAIAGIIFPSRPTVAIFWFGVTGILSATSGCCFWSARERNALIIWLWLLGCLLVSAGCFAWARTNPRPIVEQPVVLTTEDGDRISAGKTADVNPGPTSPTPEPTPLPATGITNNATEFNFTPKQIVDKVFKTESGWKQEEIRKAVEGLSVNWVVEYFSSSRLQLSKSEKLFVAFRSEATVNAVLITFPVPLKGNEHLALTETTRKFRVRGVIESVKDSQIITLREGATFEPVSK